MASKKRTAGHSMLAPDPIYDSLLVTKFINCLMWQGKKSIAQKMFYDAMEQIKQSDSENARLKDVMALLNAPETLVRVSSEGAQKPPQGKVFVNPNRGVLLLASNLPPAPAASDTKCG